MYPRLLHLYGPAWIQAYGFMIALGFTLFLILTFRHPRRKLLVSDDVYLNTVFVGLVSGIIGGRLLYIATAWQEFQGKWFDALCPWIGGLVVLGSIIGILIAVPLYLRWHNVPVLPVLDITAVYAPLLHAIARLGCFGAGCCYGLPTTAWWAITFTNQYSIAPTNVPLHPTQLYTSLACLLIFFILLKLEKKLFPKHGLLLCLFLMLENISRFTIDFWRNDSSPISISWLNQYIVLSDMQWLSLVSFMCTLILFIILARRKPSSIQLS